MGAREGSGPSSVNAVLFSYNGGSSRRETKFLFLRVMIFNRDGNWTRLDSSVHSFHTFVTCHDTPGARRKKREVLNFRLLIQLSLPGLITSGVLLIGACSPTEDEGDGDAGDGDAPSSGGDQNTAGTGGDPNQLGTGGAPNQPGTGGDSNLPGSGGTAGTGGNAEGTGGESPGSGGESPGSGGNEGNAECDTEAEDLFSFFATSHAALIRESGNEDGFGGDLGGLAGADAICQSIAEFSSPCQTNKTWRAFLSTSTEDAIDRIGTGPWHDRLGRLLANDLTELLNDRPPNAHPEIKDDFPNEDGVPNQYPDGEHVDNHQFLTGTGLDGRVYAINNGAGSICADEFSVAAATCNDWTTSEEVGCPRVGHSWPRAISGINWISVWNEGGCAPGGVLTDDGGPDGTRRVGSAGGYGGFYCFAVTGQ